MYCQTIFRGDGVNTQVTSANVKLVLMRLETNGIKQGWSKA